MLPQFRYMVSRFADLMGENADTLSVRFRLLETAWELFRNNPILGYGSTKDSIAILIFRETGFPKVSHNAYLDIGLQAGLAGLLAFGALYFNILYDFARKLIARSGQTKWQYPIYLIFLNTLVAGLVLSLNFRDIHIYIIAFAIVLPGLGREKSIDLVMIWKRIVKLRIPIVISMAAALLAGILSGLLIPETAYRSVIEVNATKTQKALTDEFKNYLDEDMQVQFKRHNWFMREFSVKLIATTEVYERVFGSVSATGFWNDFDEFAKGIDIDMRSGNINERLTVVYGEKEASAEVIEKLRNELLLEFENMVMEGIYKEIDFRRDRVEENIEKYKSEKLDDYLESIEYNKAFIARLEIAAEGSYENLVEGNIAIVEKGEGLTKNVPGTGLLTMVLMGLLWIMVIQAVHILRKEEI